jgi:hypothetical protein
VRVEQTSFSRMTLFDDGIVEAQPLATDEPRTAHVLSEAMDAIATVGGGQSRPVLWNPTGTLPLRPDGWQTIVRRAEQTISALAIVIGPEDESLLGAFPQTMDSLLIPVRVFHSETEARAWLLPFVEAAPVD